MSEGVTSRPPFRVFGAPSLAAHMTTAWCLRSSQERSGVVARRRELGLPTSSA